MAPSRMLAIGLAAGVVIVSVAIFALSGGDDEPAVPTAPEASPTATAVATSEAAATSAPPTAAAPASTSVPAATATAAPSCPKKDGRDEAADALVPLSTVVLRITEGGATAHEFSYDEFADFAFDCIDLRAQTGGDEDDQSGPLLTELLAAAGFSNWATIEISGVIATNNDVAASTTVSFAEASQGWLVTIDKNGRVRFPDPRGSSRADWLAAITEIAVIE